MQFSSLIFALIATSIAYPVLLGPHTPAQTSQDQQCTFAIVRGNEIDHKIEILAKPEPQFSDSDRQQFSGKVVVLTATFCGSGEVVDIKVKRGVSDTVEARAIDAARKIKFIPAEKDGKKVSQVLTIEYHI